MRRAARGSLTLPVGGERAALIRVHLSLSLSLDLSLLRVIASRCTALRGADEVRALRSVACDSAAGGFG